MSAEESQSQLNAPAANAADSGLASEQALGRPAVPGSPSGNDLIKAEVDDEDAGVDTKTMANAPFVNKVWRIVNDPANHPFIRWVPGGKSIQIVDREGFEKQLLPYYFKHKRFTSFVRQLNMYGWHKVQDLSAGTMQSSEEHWQFANPNFIQGHPELLQRIVRNKGHRPGASSSNNAVDTWRDTQQASNEGDDGDKDKDLKAILRELEQIKSRQIHIGEDLGRMRKDNELLWAEYYQTRERYDKHSQMLSRILRFLATVYGNQSKILDLSDPNTPAGAAAAERIIRGPADSPQQHYLQLLPANNADKLSPAESFKSSSAHDLQEIEQMQNQIQEANTPSSSTSRESYSADPLPRQTGQNYMNGYDPTRMNARNDGKLSAGASRALVPSRRVSQALVAPYAAQGNRVTPLNDTPAGVMSSGPNNQLVRATNPRLVPQAGAGAPQITPLQQYQSPQLQEIPNNYDDPDKLFPELDDFSRPTGPPDMEQISREIASNNSSLQTIQDWLNEQSLDDHDEFKLDDFLSTDDDKTRGGAAVSPNSVPTNMAPTAPSNSVPTGPAPANAVPANSAPANAAPVNSVPANSNNKGSAEPDRKRVRVG